MKRDKLACSCRKISYGMIEEAIIKKGAKNFQEVQEITGCGKACGKCQDFIKILVRDILWDMEK